MNNNDLEKDKINKGQFGYIDYEKKKGLILSIISIMSVLIIFFTGVIIYKTNKSLFSIIAAVASLPAAKLVTRYVVIMSYKTGKRTVYDRLNDIVSKNPQYKAIIGSDFIISSTAKNMGITFAYIINGKLMCYTDHKKTNAKELEKYLHEIYDKDQCKYSQIKVYDDENKFLTGVEHISMEEGKEYTDKRIYDRLCIYSM